MQDFSIKMLSDTEFGDIHGFTDENRKGWHVSREVAA